MSVFPSMFIVLLVLSFYLAFYAVAFNGRIQAFLRDRLPGDAFTLCLFFFRKLTGALFLGILPFYFFSAFYRDIITLIRWDVNFSSLTWGILILLTLAVVLINYFAGQRPEAYQKYPHLRFKEWNLFKWLANLAGWAIYLVSYEFLIRGILFTGSLMYLDLWTAIGINALFYAGIHLPQGKTETIGSLFFGVILCLMVYHSGSLVPAILLHASLTFSMDLSVIWHHQEMRFSGSLTGKQR